MFVNGVKEGKGTVIHTNYTYEGSFLDGVATGYGVVTYRSGIKYSGMWRSGNRVGWGVQRQPNGTVYTGYFNNGKAEGPGVMKYPDGTELHCRFVNNEIDTIFKKVLPNGGVYVGEYQGKELNGYGSLTINGDIYTGRWFMNRMYGLGTLKRYDGSLYTGKFVNGNVSEYGVCEYSNGVKYFGRWLRGRFDGKGIIKYSDGSILKGNFRYGDFHGSSKLKTVDNIKIYTKYQFGKIESEKVVYPDGTIYIYHASEQGLDLSKCIYLDGTLIDIIYTPSGMRQFYIKYPNNDYLQLTHNPTQNTYIGVYTFSNNIKYYGEFKDLTFHGKGKLVYLNGDMLEGIFEEGVITGLGVYKAKNGNIITGE